MDLQESSAQITVETIRDPGMKWMHGPTTHYKDPPAPFYWRAYVPKPGEHGIVYCVSGWAGSAWAAGAEAMHTYADRFVPGHLGWR